MNLEDNIYTKFYKLARSLHPTWNAHRYWLQRNITKGVGTKTPLRSSLYSPVHNHFLLGKLGIGNQPATCSFADEWLLLFHTIYENKSSTLLPVLFKKICCFYSLYLILKGKKYSYLAFGSLTLNSYTAKVIVFFLSRYLINFAWKYFYFSLAFM